MSYEEELEALQAEAMSELEGETSDTNTDDNQFEEPIDTTDNDGEVENDGEDTEEYEDENDSEDGDELDEEDGEDYEDDDDDTSDSQDNDSSENNDGFEPVEVTVGGQTISLNSQEELLQFVKRRGTSEGKTKSRKSENDQVIEQGNLSQADLALLIDAKNGNKAAIAKLAKDSGVDIYDIDDDAAAGYQQEFQATLATEVDNVATDIMEDVELHTEFKKVVNNVPQDFAQMIASDASALKHFASHVKSGLAQKIIPEAMKQQMLHGGSFFENYTKIGKEMHDSEKSPEKSKTKRKENPRAANLRKRASTPKGKNKGTKTKITGDDVWNMSSEDFNKQYM